MGVLGALCGRRRPCSSVWEISRRISVRRAASCLLPPIAATAAAAAATTAGQQRSTMARPLTLIAFFAVGLGVYLLSNRGYLPPVVAQVGPRKGKRAEWMLKLCCCTFFLSAIRSSPSVTAGADGVLGTGHPDAGGASGSGSGARDGCTRAFGSSGSWWQRWPAGSGGGRQAAKEEHDNRQEARIECIQCIGNLHTVYRKSFSGL